MYRQLVFSLEPTPGSSCDRDALPCAASLPLPGKPLPQLANIFAQNLKKYNLRESPTASQVILRIDEQLPHKSPCLLLFLREASSYSRNVIFLTVWMKFRHEGGRLLWAG